MEIADLVEQLKGFLPEADIKLEWLPDFLGGCHYISTERGDSFANCYIKIGILSRLNGSVIKRMAELLKQHMEKR